MTKLDYLPGTKKYLHFRGKAVELTYGADGLWRDSVGGLYGYTSKAFGGDKPVRCGIGVFALPESDVFTYLASPHDYKYCCPVYQLYHTRAEADADLERDLAQWERIDPGAGHWHSWLVKPFYRLVRAFGSMFWETKETRR